LYVKANYRNYTGYSVIWWYNFLFGNPRTENQKISKLVNDDRTFLVDVRTPEEYNAEKIEGAVNIRWIRLKTDYLNFKVKRI
jgi:hypothetical protein